MPKKIDLKPSDPEDLAIAKICDEMQRHLWIVGAMAAYLRQDELCEIIYEAIAEIDHKAATRFAARIGRKL